MGSCVHREIVIAAKWPHVLLETRTLFCPSDGHLIQKYKIVSSTRQDTKYPNPVLSTTILVGAWGWGTGEWGVASRRGGMQGEERGWREEGEKEEGKRKGNTEWRGSSLGGVQLQEVRV